MQQVTHFTETHTHMAWLWLFASLHWSQLWATVNGCLNEWLASLSFRLPFRKKWKKNKIRNSNKIFECLQSRSTRWNTQTHLLAHFCFICMQSVYFAAFARLPNTGIKFWHRHSCASHICEPTKTVCLLIFFSIAKRSWIHSEQCRKPPPPPPLPSSFTLCIYFAVACKLIGDDVQIAVRPTSEKQFYTRIALCTGARATLVARVNAQKIVWTHEKKNTRICHEYGKHDAH